MIKFILEFLKKIVLACVSLVVGNMIISTTPKDISRVKRWMTFIGGAVISWFVTNSVTTFVERKITEFKELVSKIFKQVKKIKEDEKSEEKIEEEA